MKMRSWLFVPGDSERKLAKIPDSDADIVIIDLEDAVAPANKAAARNRTATFLREADRATLPPLWVRINAYCTNFVETDLDAVVPAAPAGIMLPKPDGVHDVVRLDEALTKLERDHGVENEAIPVCAVITETAAGVAAMSGYTAHPRRLGALSWGAEDLAVDLGATRSRESDGMFVELFRHVRAQFRLAAAAAGLPAIDTVYTDYRDSAGLARYAGQARADGFAGMLAIHPAQIPVINAAFTPSAEEIESARRVIAAVEDGDGVGTLDGRMVDRPHLEQARRVLALAATLE